VIQLRFQGYLFFFFISTHFVFLGILELLNQSGDIIDLIFNSQPDILFTLLGDLVLAHFLSSDCDLLIIHVTYGATTFGAYPIISVLLLEN